MVRPLKWRVSVEGADKTVSDIRRVRGELEKTTSSTDQYISARKKEYTQARFINNEDKREAAIWLSKHRNIRQLSDSFTTLSRIMHVALTAQNALNLAQLVFGQKSSAKLQADLELRQIQREKKLAQARGASAQELADFNEQENIAKTRIKETDDAAKADNISNILQLVTTFGFLGSSIGSIVTKAPQLIGILRRLGGRGGAGGGLGGGFGSTGSPTIGGGSGGGFGSTGGIVGSTGSVGGRCMSMCQETITKLSSSFAKDFAKYAIPVLGGVLAGYFIPQLLDQPGKTPAGGAGGGGKNYNVNLKDDLKILDNVPKLIVENTKKTKDSSDKVRNIYEELWSAQWAAKGTVINTTEAAKETAKSYSVNLTETLGIADNNGKKISASMQKQVEEAAKQAALYATITAIISSIASFALSRGGTVPLGGVKNGIFGLSPLPNSVEQLGGGKPAPAPAPTVTYKGLTGQAAINAKKAGFAAGGSFIAGSPQMIKVGEAGAERVDVTPLGSRGGSGGGTVINNYYNIAGSVWSQNELMAVIDNHRKRAVRARNIGT